MSTFLVPLVNTPQIFTITLNTTEYILTSKYNNSIDGGWVLDIADALTNTLIVANVPLVTGIDLLYGLEYLGISGSLYVYTDGDDFAVPTYENLGIQSNLYFVTVI